MEPRHSNDVAVKDRRTFLAALGVAGASLALRVRGDRAEASPAPALSPHAERPLPVPSRSPVAKQPSAAAAAVAATFRRFDPELSDADIGTIARGIDDSVKAGLTLDPKKKPLHNGDEPVTIFTVPA